ncbi:hypothetical protein AVEN_35257-1 [Araneus ventricosus]|uniref:Uncharacterized protein n=1 Tax=Araneus ventricosus TaxID=182803 RepID=A0A4Y2EIB6_ARAVE|nr:hypothetical protein AVEN_35257-1 [Araneus ventricosus]
MTSICTRRRIMSRSWEGGVGWGVISEVPTISKGRGQCTPSTKRELESEISIHLRQFRNCLLRRIGLSSGSGSPMAVEVRFPLGFKVMQRPVECNWLWVCASVSE